MTKNSEKNISKRNNISTNSVNRILDCISKDKYVKNNGKLPTSFGIDELSATKDTISKKAIKTFLNYENYIINSFDYELSNAIVEGTNNLIKQVKHNARGYRIFI